MLLKVMTSAAQAQRGLICLPACILHELILQGASTLDGPVLKCTETLPAESPRGLAAR